MSVLHLDILLHYYSIVGEYPQIPDNDTRTDYAYELVKLGLLYSPKKDANRLFAITEYGKVVTENMLKYFGEITHPTQ